MKKEEVQFHIRCKAGDVGRYCILPGDPGRCAAICGRFPGVASKPPQSKKNAALGRLWPKK